MDYAIVYDSKTGNTEQLAEAIAETLPAEGRLAYGRIEDVDRTALDAAERVYVGFWTNKGYCGDEIAGLLASLAGREVFLFGTAGFGSDETYFAGVAARVLANLPGSAEVVGTFMCQGRMPQSVRTRYEHRAAENPAQAPRLQQMIENFDRAATHPDANDLARLRAALEAAC
ncbi:flavodoxin family protein BilS [Gordonibacter sp.]|uniref:flavodoxin family protein BilS n=1 Tax=Gordonibacter sp. TaxID=1968902 RepID=UPI002FCA4C77